MSHLPDFLILRHEKASRLEEAVNYQLADGYVLRGDVFQWKTPEGLNLLCQVMVKRRGRRSDVSS
jgi:hypothetical protein